MTSGRVPTRRRQRDRQADFAAILTAEQVRTIRTAAERSNDLRRLRASVALLAVSHEALRISATGEALPGDGADEVVAERHT